MLHQALTNSYGSRLLSCIDYRDRASRRGPSRASRRRRPNRRTAAGALWPRPRARPGGRRASSRLGAGRERVELEAAGHTTYQRERPSAPVGPLARCANARWPRSDSTSLFAVCWYPRGCEPCVCPRTPETSGTGSGTVRPSPGQYESTSVNDVRRWFPTLAR